MSAAIRTNKRDITIRHVTKPGYAGTTLHYSTLKRARAGARAKVGARPRLDVDGYAVGPDGSCLFFKGTTFEELFPTLAE